MKCGDTTSWAGSHRELGGVRAGCEAVDTAKASTSLTPAVTAAVHTCVCVTVSPECSGTGLRVTSGCLGVPGRGVSECVCICLGMCLGQGRAGLLWLCPITTPLPVPVPGAMLVCLPGC